jgi:cytochrome c-type biogenesis protein CcmH/NrfG
MRIRFATTHLALAASAAAGAWLLAACQTKAPAKAKPAEAVEQEAEQQEDGAAPAAPQIALTPLEPVLIVNGKSAPARAGGVDWRNAEKKARAVLRKEPLDANALRQLTAALLQQGRFELASLYAEQLAGIKDSEADGQTMLAMARYLGRESLDDVRTATTMLQETVKKNPKHVASIVDLGVVYLETGRTAEALKAFEIAVKRCETCAQPFLGLAAAQSVAGAPKDAAKTLERLLSRSPKDLEARLYLAVLYKDALGNAEKAKSLVKEVLASAPKANVDLRRRAQMVLQAH